MRFINKPNVSESNFRMYKADFENKIREGKIEEAKLMYEHFIEE